MKHEMHKLTKSLAWAFASVALSVQTALGGNYDNFANAYEIPAGATSFTFSNSGNTLETGEPRHSSDRYAGGASGWATWTAPKTGDYTFRLAGRDDASFDTQLAIYTGASVGALTLVASNDDSPLGGYSSLLSFRATAGVKYRIAMDSYNGTPGYMTLSWEAGVAPYLRFKGYGLKAFAPSSGCTTEIEVDSSVAWSVVGRSDWITPNTMSGSSGSKLSFTVQPNSTGSTRKGELKLQLGGETSQQVTLSVWQHVLDFVTTKAAAESAAKSKNKRILLIYGREECWNTRTTLFSSVPAADVKQLIESDYVIWYSNFDRQSEALGYASGLSSLKFPLICIINPASMSTYVAREMDYHDADALLQFLKSSGGTTIWTLKYHSNNGKNNLASQNFVQGKVQRLFYMDSRLGWEYKDEDGFNYMFLGWAKSPTGAVAYENGELVQDLAAAGKVMHIYAVWQKRAYEVCFHSNDGRNLSKTQEFRPNIAKNLLWLDSGLGWTRSGYDFLGWAKAPTSTAVVYANGQNVNNLVEQGQTLHLYAVWRDRRWTIRFHRNYSSSDNTYEDQKIPVGASVKLLWLDSQLKWTRDGYWFKGWAKSRTAGAAYTNGQTVKDLVPGGQVLHLYGAWGQKTK